LRSESARNKNNNRIKKKKINQKNGY